MRVVKPVGGLDAQFLGVAAEVGAASIPAGSSSRRNGSMTAAGAVTALYMAVVVWSAPAAAATLTAASCSYSDVSAAVGRAGDGDTVAVPAGNCTWNSGLAISKAIMVKGAGVGRTLITNNNTASDLIQVTESPAGSIRIQGFDFSAGTGPGAGFFYIKVGLATNGQPVLITANNFVLGVDGNALGVGTNRGVIWNNTASGTITGGNYLNNASFLRHKPNGLTSSWAAADTMGSADTNGRQNLYVETNTFTNVFETVDVDDNARTVIRYNTFRNASVIHHGNDTSAIGARYSEIYQNQFIYDQTPVPGPSGPLPANVTSFIALRGGTSVIWQNSIDALMSQAWGTKAAVNFNAENLRRNAGPYACYIGGYPIPNQVGQGSDAFGHQIPDPVYLWGNTGSGNYNDPSINDYPCGQNDSCSNCTSRASAAAYIVSNRNYYVNAQRPGYTPYSYPHPLTGSATQVSPPAAPTNLRVR